LRPAQVQGDGAAEDVACGIREVACAPGVDVIIVGRGGGSMEDLWAFNEEAVVRAVAACPVPVISAVGHETDTTLCDYAADMRAPTPSAAAELAVPEREALLASVEELRTRAFRAAQAAGMLAEKRLKELLLRLEACQPLHHVARMRQQALHLQTRLRIAQAQQLERLAHRAAALTEHLRAVSPRRALERGYAIALRGKTPVTEVSAAAGDMTLLFRDGRASVRVLSVKEGDPFAREEGKEL
ncbi:MAG: exodeoxyribonuclease VII large subunit, partial [Clostridia bacterium]|nr:exodeoxyribonuclease VII large subunit [Clostridia bacterium]